VFGPSSKLLYLSLENNADYKISFNNTISKKTNNIKMKYNKFLKFPNINQDPGHGIKIGE